MSNIVEVKNLKMYFGSLRAVDDIDLSIKENEFLGLVGESGCGKSTLGRCILGLNQKTSGEIALNVEGKNGAQMIFQNPFSSLNPRKTIKSTLKEVLKVNGLNKGEENKRIEEILHVVGLNKDALNKYPKQFSGGQLQRIAIARALLLNPQFLVADEPVSALDVSVQAQVLNLFKDLKQEFHLSMLFISHNLSVVEYLCDRIAVMYLGKIVELATVEELYQNALHPYTKSLIAAIPLPEVQENNSFYDGILSGELPNPSEEHKGCRFASRCPYKSAICEEQEAPLTRVNGKEEHMVACHNIGGIANGN
ncbi:MAG: ABC transporter ATP-binding protein [Roseburia sp.]